MESTQDQDNPQVPLARKGQGEAQTEVQEVSPPIQEVQASPFTPKKRKIKTLIKRRQKVNRRVIPSPSVPEVIPEGEEEEDDEDEDDNLPLNMRNPLARATKLEWKRSSTITLPPIPEHAIQSTTSEDEMQQWINEQDVKGTDVFKMSYFNFMLVGTKWN